MEIQREKDRVVELTNDNKKYRSLKKVWFELTVFRSVHAIEINCHVTCVV